MFAGFDFLDAGSIIGIVVGSLVIILAFIIVAYSRRTGRLCFAGESVPFIINKVFQLKLIGFVHHTRKSVQRPISLYYCVI